MRRSPYHDEVSFSGFPSRIEGFPRWPSTSLTCIPNPTWAYAPRRRRSLSLSAPEQAVANAREAHRQTDAATAIFFAAAGRDDVSIPCYPHRTTKHEPLFNFKSATLAWCSGTWLAKVHSPSGQVQRAHPGRRFQRRSARFSLQSQLPTWPLPSSSPCTRPLGQPPGRW